MNVAPHHGAGGAVCCGGITGARGGRGRGFGAVRAARLPGTDRIAWLGRRIGGLDDNRFLQVDAAAEHRRPLPVPICVNTGLHALRHWFASWCINSKADGGLELSPKAVQTRMGHSSIQVTFDTYGHLFPAADEAQALADAEGRLLAVNAT